MQGHEALLCLSRFDRTTSEALHSWNVYHEMEAVECKDASFESVCDGKKHGKLECSFGARSNWNARVVSKPVQKCDPGAGADTYCCEDRSSLSNVWFLKQMAGRCICESAEDPFAGADIPRIHERITTFLEGAYVGFHFGQLTPQEFYAMVSDTWLRRYVSFHEARATSSSKRRAERFRYMGGVADGDSDVVDGAWTS